MRKKDQSTHSIADSYKAISIGTYLDSILPVARDESIDPLDRQVELIASANGMTAQEVLGLGLEDYAHYAAALKFLEKPYEPRAGRIASSFRIGAFNLVPLSSYDKMTAGQFIDFQTLSKDPEANIVALLSVFLVPDGHAYNDGYDIAEVQSAISSMLSVADAMDVMAFFLTRCAELSLSFLSYSEKAAKRMKDRTMLKRIREAREILSRSGDGSQT